MKKGEYVNMNFFDMLNELGIGWRYVLNGFIGAVVWSIYKKLRLIEALRQILIGSIVAGYITPLIAHKEAIPIEFMAALSFIIGMMGMIIIDGIYKYIANKVKLLRKGKELINKEELENSEI
jgi:hypothetical protein